MPGLLENCELYFETRDLYEVLGVKSRTASEKELKKAYYKVSLKVHPDRVSDAEKEEATTKFQTLGKVYAVLSDKEKRATYDETGTVDEEDDIAQDRDWMEYWRLLYKKVSVNDIKQFEEQYKGSEEELNDLKAAYTKCKGDMDEIIDSVMCASIDDEDRFREILTNLIKKKELPKYKAFTKESAEKKTGRRKRAAAEAEEADKIAAELNMKDKSLENMIAMRNSDREKQADAFFANLEAKYAKPKKSKKGK